MKNIFSNRTALKSLLFIAVFNILLFAQEKKTALIIPDTSKKNIPARLDSASIKQPKVAVKRLKSSSFLPSSLPSYSVTRSAMESMDYRFTGDILKNSSFIFLKDLGYTGLPNEVMLYGQGNRSSAFFNNGIEVSNLLFNSFDPNLYQSESLDSIEVIPFPRGFLLGNTNIASVNLISREPALSKPYSRIKYYQAPDDEAYMDGIFSISPFKKTNLYFEVTNHSNGARYKTSQARISDYTNWMADVRLNYFLSEKINIHLNYKYVSSIIQLYGGVDADSVRQIVTSSGQFETILYDNILAPLRFTNRYQASTLNHYSATMLMRLIENAPSEFSIYASNDLTEYRQNISGNFQSGAPQVRSDNKTKTFGFLFKQDFSDEFISIKSLSKIERIIYDTRLSLNADNQTAVSSSVTADLKLLNNSFIPGFFAKYLQLSGNSCLGLGADAVIHLGNDFNIYSGYSYFKKPYTLLEQSYAIRNDLNNGQNIHTAEIKFSSRIKSVNFSLGYFVTRNDNDLIPALLPASYKNDEANFVDVVNTSLQGLNAAFDIRFWKISISSNSTFYFSESDRIKKGLPEFTSLGGIYYIDTLFNKNLKLKTGFNYYSYGSRYEQRFDFEKGIASSYLYDPYVMTFLPNRPYLINSSPVSPSFQLDFFLAGRIQEAAVIYFAWENLFNSQYSVIPYYPMQSRTLRFGFSWEFFD